MTPGGAATMASVALAQHGENPFQPRLEGVPLLLTLDARSLSTLTGEDRERAEFLCELGLTPAVDALWSWGAEPLVTGLPQAELRPLDEGRDDRAVGLVGQPHGFIGGVAGWSTHERIADSYELVGPAREWFTYYSTATKFHTNAKRHFFVTADSRLLSERRAGPRQGYWQRARVAPVAGALRLAGQVMLAQERIYDKGAPYTSEASAHTLYFYLAPELAPSRIRLHRWLEGQTLQAGSELEALEQSMHDRVVDLLKARDHIALQSARQQNPATVDEILYHLRAAIGSAAALFDSIAVFAQFANQIGHDELGGVERVSLRNRKFRQLLTAHSAVRLAAAAGELAPLLNFVWTLRTPIVHREGLSGMTYRKLDGPGASESRVGLTQEQSDSLDALRGQRRESAEQWGQSEFARTVRVEPHTFSNRFCLAAVEAAERLNHALADDLGAPDHSFARDSRERRRIQRYRWLVGLPSEGFFPG